MRLSNYKLYSDKYKITDQNSYYVMYQYFSGNKWGLGPNYYRIEGHPTYVENRIKKEKQTWPPEGYGTIFYEIESNKEDIVIYEGSRSNSCD